MLIFNVLSISRTTKTATLSACTPAIWSANGGLLLAESKIPPTHLLGEAAREAAIEALLVPSARLSGTKNIAIITDRVRIGSFFEIYPPEGFVPGTATRVDGRYDP
jgi:hypothetical protein